MVKVVLKEYLSRLKKQEKQKPVHERRPVPTIKELAQAAGVSRNGYLGFLHNRTRGLNRDFIDTAITMLHACGFDTNISDILRYEPDESKTGYSGE